MKKLNSKKSMMSCALYIMGLLITCVACNNDNNNNNSKESITLTSLCEDFSIDNYPKNNTWIIDDKEFIFDDTISNTETTETSHPLKCYKGVINLYAAISAYNKINNKLINLEFPNLVNMNVFQYKDYSFWYNELGSDPLENNPKNFDVIKKVSAPTATTMYKMSFQGFSELEEVCMPNIIILEPFAFNGCKKLQTVSLESVEEIKEMTFAGCSSLKTLKLPNLKSISGFGVFQSCGLENLEISTNVKLEELNQSASIDSEQIVLKIGSQNKELINGNVLTIGGKSFTFKEIILV